MQSLIRNVLILTLVRALSSCSLGEAGTEPLGQRKVKDEGQGSVQITVHNEETKEGCVHFNGYLREVDSNEPLLFASVAFYAGDELIAGIESDFDGWYSLLIPFDSLPEAKNLRI